MTVIGCDVAVISEGAQDLGPAEQEQAAPGEELVNVTAGLPDGPSESALEKRVKDLEEEAQCLRHKLSDKEAENMQLDIEKSRLQNENAELQVQLSRSRRAHAEERAGRTRARSQYQDIINECAMAPSDLSKKIAEHRSRIDELESGHQFELDQQKEFWGEINAMLTKENEEAQETIKALREALEDQKETFDENRENMKNRVRELEDDVMKANEAKSEWQSRYDGLQLEVSKLRQEKVQLGTSYEHQMMERNEKQLRDSRADAFDADEIMRMMQETMADDNDREDSPAY